MTGAQAGEDVDQQGGGGGDPGEPRHRGAIGAPDPDADDVPAIEAQGPGIAVAIGGAGLEGQAGGVGRLGRRGGGQDIGDLPGGALVQDG